MAQSSLRENQIAMARYLRDPARQAAPAGVEARRLKIYEDLVYNNIESFINSGFPVLRSLYRPEDWRHLVRDFMQRHRCHSPYFLEISQEFLLFLMEDHKPRACDPAFMTELAHYEWVELALDVSEEELPEMLHAGNLPCAVLGLSPVAWSLAYRYPVHHIGPDWQPHEPEPPTYIVVYRDRGYKVRFMEVNAPTARLLELVRTNEAATAIELIEKLAGELDVAVDSIRDFALDQLQQFIRESVVVVISPGQVR
ncbi:MAG: putative DNA-binding domain-containing protein [Halioglobus sp.]|nr:putative DNA-binding domain-containing protein [Halioglobus sp.]